MSIIFYLYIFYFLFLSFNKPNDWIYLFNGKNLDGWKIKIRGHEVNDNYKNTFQVNDGVLEVSYDGYESFDDKFGHIFYTKQEFKNYHLSLEYRFFGSHLKGAPSWSIKNSGVMLHSQSPNSMLLNQEFPLSVEAQFLGGLKMGESRPTLNMCSPGSDVDIDGLKASSHCVNSYSKTYYSDQWIHVEMVVYSDSIIHHIIDSDTVLSYTNIKVGGEFVPDSLKENIGKSLQKGFISLQSEGHPIQFKNIKIKTL